MPRDRRGNDHRSIEDILARDLSAISGVLFGAVRFGLKTAPGSKGGCSIWCCMNSPEIARISLSLDFLNLNSGALDENRTRDLFFTKDAWQAQFRGEVIIWWSIWFCTF